MKAWIKEHQKVLSLGVGSFLIVVGTVMLFWTNTGDAVSDEERIAAANIARMEARMAAPAGTAPKSPAEKPDFMDSYVQKQKMQLRYMVIVMLIGGVCFLGYGLLKMKNEK